MLSHSFIGRGRIPDFVDFVCSIIDILVQVLLKGHVVFFVHILHFQLVFFF